MSVQHLFWGILFFWVPFLRHLNCHTEVSEVNTDRSDPICTFIPHGIFMSLCISCLVFHASNTHINKHYDHYCVDVSLLYSLQGFTSRGPNCHKHGSKCSKIQVVRVTSSGVFLLLFSCPAAEPFVLAVFCAPVRIHYQIKLLTRLKFRRWASVATIVRRRCPDLQADLHKRTWPTCIWPVHLASFYRFLYNLFFLNAPQNMVITLKNLIKLDHLLFMY